MYTFQNWRLYSYRHSTILSSLRNIVNLVGALEHLHDLLHDRGVHALGLLELLAVAEDNSGGSLGDTEVLLYVVSVHVHDEKSVQKSYPCVGLLTDVDLVGTGGAGELLGVPGRRSLIDLVKSSEVNNTYSSAWEEGVPS
jgi:hypothetical protein